MFDIDFSSKPQTRRLARLDLEICSGVMVDWSQWIPREQFDRFSLDDLEFQVIFDGTVVWSGLPTGTGSQILIEFPDTGDHVLEFSLQGITDQHMPVHDSQEFRSCVHLKSVMLEDFDILDYLVSGHWNLENGDSQVFPTHIADNGHARFQFSGPIYQWLIGFNLRNDQRYK